MGLAPVMVASSREERMRGRVKETRELMKIREENERLRENERDLKGGRGDEPRVAKRRPALCRG